MGHQILPGAYSCVLLSHADAESDRAAADALQLSAHVSPVLRFLEVLRAAAIIGCRLGFQAEIQDWDSELGLEFGVLCGGPGQGFGVLCPDQLYVKS